jgi:hypothetical protein
LILHRWAIIAATLTSMSANAAFAALPVERAMAGVSVGSKGIVVLRKYGNPTDVTPGLGALLPPNTVATTGPNAAPATAPGIPPGAGGPYNPYAMGPGGLPPGIPPVGGTNQLQQGLSNLANTYNSYLNEDSGSLSPAGADTSATGMDETGLNSGLTTWTYEKLRKGPRIDFRLDEDGSVVEMCAFGTKPSPLTRTARGVNLGDPYGKVMRMYGFPDQSVQQGDILTVSFAKSAHIAFQFYKLKLVRIDIAKQKKAQTITL